MNVKREEQRTEKFAKEGVERGNLAERMSKGKKGRRKKRSKKMGEIKHSLPSMVFIQRLSKPRRKRSRDPILVRGLIAA